MKYEIDFLDYKTGATSPIDTVDTTVDYTADSYIEDCKINADSEWNSMLENGKVIVLKVEE